MLKDTEYAYAVARIRCNEAKLLPSSTVESLINASDYNDALKILSECGYGDFEKYGEDVVLSNRIKEAFELIYKSAPEKSCLDFLIVKNDFHNIKACLKGMIVGADVSKLMLSPSSIDASLLKDALETKDYSKLPSYIADCLKEAYDLITTTMDGQVAEIFIDKKCIEASVYLAKLSKDEFSVSLAILMATLSNIKIALRCLKTGKDKNFIMSALSDVDGVDKQALCSAVLEGEEALCGFVKSIGFELLSESIKNGYAAFEKLSDDMLIEKIRHAKYQCLGISPLVAYYFATDAEVKTVRIILSCKKNGLDIDSIRERVRVLYV